MPVTPVNGSANFPATPNSFLAAVETIAQQNVRSVVSTNKIEDAFYEYDVKDGKVIEEAIIAMASAQTFTPTATGVQPDLAPLDPSLYIRYFNNFEEKQFNSFFMPSSRPLSVSSNIGNTSPMSCIVALP